MIRYLVSGVLHADPQERTSHSGKLFTTAKLKADGKDGNTIWCNLIAFGSDAERLATFKNGAALCVSGRTELTAWMDKQGEPKAGLSLVVEEMATLRARPKPQRPLRPSSAPLNDLDAWQH